MFGPPIPTFHHITAPQVDHMIRSGAFNHTNQMHHMMTNTAVHNAQLLGNAAVLHLPPVPQVQAPPPTQRAFLNIPLPPPREVHHPPQVVQAPSAKVEGGTWKVIHDLGTIKPGESPIDQVVKRASAEISGSCFKAPCLTNPVPKDLARVLCFERCEKVRQDGIEQLLPSVAAVGFSGLAGAAHLAQDLAKNEIDNKICRTNCVETNQ